MPCKSFAAKNRPTDGERLTSKARWCSYWGYGPRSARHTATIKMQSAIMYDIMQSTAHPYIKPNAAFQRILDAVEVLKEYDGKNSDIPGEAYAHLMLGLEKAPRGTAGYDFTDANGRRV